MSRLIPRLAIGIGISMAFVVLSYFQFHKGAMFYCWGGTNPHADPQAMYGFPLTFLGWTYPAADCQVFESDGHLVYDPSYEKFHWNPVALIIDLALWGLLLVAPRFTYTKIRGRRSE